MLFCNDLHYAQSNPPHFKQGVLLQNRIMPAKHSMPIHGSSRILVECTYVFAQPWVRSGIQRVVRNIALNTRGITADKPLDLVALAEGRVFLINRLLPSGRIGISQAAKLFSWLSRARAAVRRKLANRVEADGSNLGPMRCLFLKTTTFVFSVSILVLGCLGLDPFRRRATPSHILPSDTLLLLDSSWHDPILFQQVADLKKKGTRIISVVYDLIPIQHPEYCEKNLVCVFNSWFSQMTQLADGFICISRWVCEKVKGEVCARLGEEQMQTKSYNWFHLGAELDLKGTGENARAGLFEGCFGSEFSTFLVVGTIEPRKNHNLILDALETHWARGGTSKLCIIGRAGWMCEEVTLRIGEHPQQGKKLFWFEDASDDDLELAYRNANALIFGSFVEGFGLPLVEALQRGLPVIASDIPVFREVAGSFAEYFDPHSATDLCSIIDQFSVTKKLPNARSVTEWKWITWNESAQQLFNAVDQCRRELDERRSLSNAH
jgi:alpha-1,2-rhamnosyltransferase